jgi:hypothetical protein
MASRPPAARLILDKLFGRLEVRDEADPGLGLAMKARPNEGPANEF